MRFPEIEKGLIPFAHIIADVLSSCTLRIRTI